MLSRRRKFHSEPHWKVVACHCSRVSQFVTWPHRIRKHVRGHPETYLTSTLYESYNYLVVIGRTRCLMVVCASGQVCNPFLRWEHPQDGLCYDQWQGNSWTWWSADGTYSLKWAPNHGEDLVYAILFSHINILGSNPHTIGRKLETMTLQCLGAERFSVLANFMKTVSWVRSHLDTEILVSK